MIVGEKQSPLVDFDSLIWSAGGDVFEDLTELIRDRPLDFGRMMYAKLRAALDDECSPEVYWNHINNEITIHISDATTGREYVIQFKPYSAARVDIIQRTDVFVDSVRRTIVEHR